MNLKKIGIVSLSLFLSLGTLGIIAESLPFAEAQESATFERSVDERLDQLTDSVAQMSENMNQLINTVSQTVDVSEVPSGIDPETGLPEGAEYRNLNPDTNYVFDATSCFSDYLSWPSSNTFKDDAEWSLHFMSNYHSTSRPSIQSLYIPMKQFTDVNGDGLQDFIYSYHATGISDIYEEGPTGISRPSGAKRYSQAMYDCLAINTGSRWEYKYRCYTTTELEDEPVGAASPTNSSPRYNSRPRFYGDCADTSGQ